MESIKKDAIASRGKALELEGLRGLAAMLVVINHLPVAPSYAGVHILGLNFSQRLLEAAGNCGELGVQIFFCLTGYLFWTRTALADRPVDWSRFYVNRFLRIAPAFFVSATVILAYVTWASHGQIETGGRELFREVFGALSFGFKNPTHINGIDVSAFNAVNWTLPYEWQFYALIPMFAAVRRSPRATAPALIAFMVFIFGQSIYLHLWLFFLTGMLAAEMPRVSKITGVWASLAVLGLIAAYVAIPYSVIPQKVFQWSLTPTLADAVPVLLKWALVSGLFFAVVILRPTIFRMRAAIWVGTVSYSLYLFHLTVLQLTARAISLAIHEWNIIIFMCWCSGSAILSICVATISYRFIESPFLRRKYADRSVPVNVAAAHG